MYNDDTESDVIVVDLIGLTDDDLDDAIAPIADIE
jgi:hypothetical protein